MQFPASPSRLFLLAVAILAIAEFAAQAIAQPAADVALAAAQARFSRALKGETEQIDSAIAAFRAAPGNPALRPLYAAYLGSALTLKGKAAWMPWNKLKFTDQGLDQLDQALSSLRPEYAGFPVQGVPLDLATRMVAAATFTAVPDGIFHRRAAARSLLAEMRRSPLLATTPASFRAELDAVEARLKEAAK
jgi:hypothetical protein